MTAGIRLVGCVAILGCTLSCVDRERVDETAALDELGSDELPPDRPAEARLDSGLTRAPTSPVESEPNPPVPRPLVPPAQTPPEAAPDVDASVQPEPEPPTPVPVSVPTGPAPLVQADAGPAVVPPLDQIDGSDIENTGVWLHSDGLAARGTGTTWEYYMTDPYYEAALWGSPEGTVWIVGSMVSRYGDGQMIGDPEFTPWNRSDGDWGFLHPLRELWGTSDQDIWGWETGGAPYVHFDGQRWTQVESGPDVPQPAWTLDTLPGEPPGPVVEADGDSDDIWAVGYTVVPSEGSVAGGGVVGQIFEGVVMHYDGTQWRDITPRRLGKLASDVWGRRLGEVWVDREARARLRSRDAGVDASAE